MWGLKEVSGACGNAGDVPLASGGAKGLEGPLSCGGGYGREAFPCTRWDYWWAVAGEECCCRALAELLTSPPHLCRCSRGSSLGLDWGCRRKHLVCLGIGAY